VTPSDRAAPAARSVLVPEAPDPALEELAHELQAPVKAIQLVAEALRASAGSLSADQLRRLIESILRSTRFMGELVDRLAHGNGSGVAALRRRPTDVGSLVFETLEDTMGILGGRRLRLRISQGARIDLDPVRVRQALVNLLSNSARYSPPGSTISVELGAEPGGISISVADECSGIRAADQHRIFRRGQRAHLEPAGAGLGLYVARAIARAHGGDLTVRSGRAGGCRFSLTLPGRPLSAVD
jgi:two-component system, OmpR family, sensor kinase